MPIPDWPRPFSGVRRSSLHSAFPVSVSAGKAPHPLPPSSFPNRTRFAGLRFGGDGGHGSSLCPSSYSRRRESKAPSCCRAVNSAMLPPVPTPENCPIMRGLSDMRGNTRRECFACFSICRAGVINSRRTFNILQDRHRIVNPFFGICADFFREIL